MLKECIASIIMARSAVKIRVKSRVKLIKIAFFRDMLRINRLITGRYARSLNTTAAVTNVSKSITKAQVQAGEREAREQERLQKNGKK